jgi:hypothetical protein
LEWSIPIQLTRKKKRTDLESLIIGWLYTEDKNVYDDNQRYLQIWIHLCNYLKKRVVWYKHDISHILYIVYIQLYIHLYHKIHRICAFTFINSLFGIS